MRLLNAGLLAVLLLLQLKLWFGDGGVRELHQVEAMQVEQFAENELLLARNKELAAEIRDLKEGSEAIAERAREELGLIGPDEEFIQVVAGGPRRD